MRTRLRMTAWFVLSGLSLLPHGALWPVATVQMRRFAPIRWWTHSPFLPLPAKDYWEFRMESVYGDPKALPSRRDLIEYLEWCLEIR